MSKDNVVNIRYRTEGGREGVWSVLRSALRDDSDEGVRKFLAHHHPEYVFLGVDGRPAPRPVRAEPEPDRDDDALIMAGAALLDSVLASAASVSVDVAPDTSSSDTSTDTSFDGGESGGGGGGDTF